MPEKCPSGNEPTRHYSPLATAYSPDRSTPPKKKTESRGKMRKCRSIEPRRDQKERNFRRRYGWERRVDGLRFCLKFPTFSTSATIRAPFRDQRASAEYSGIASAGIPSQSTAIAANARHSVIRPAARSRLCSNSASIASRNVHSSRHQSQICRSPIPSKKK